MHICPLFLRAYIDKVESEVGSKDRALLYFMQSNGDLTQADQFQGKDAILSGPAGGVVGGVKCAQALGYDRLIGFDMGGTSTDVWHYGGAYERTLETVVAGTRIRRTHDADSHRRRRWRVHPSV